MSRERERLGIAVGMLGIGVVGVGYVLWGVAGAGVGALLALAVVAFMLGSSSLPAAAATAAVLVGALALVSALTGGSSTDKPSHIAIKPAPAKATPVADVSRTAQHPAPTSAPTATLRHQVAVAGTAITKLQAQNLLLRHELATARARNKRLAHQLRAGRRK